MERAALLFVVSVPQRFRCDKKRKKNTGVIGNNAMCWEGEGFVTKSVLRYAHASPMGFHQMYPKAQISFRKLKNKLVFEGS